MSKTNKRRLVAAVAGFVLAAGIGIAVAVFVANAPISGGASSKAFKPIWTAASLDTAAGSQDMTCAVSLDTSTDPSTPHLALNVTDAWPGGFCNVQGSVMLNNAQGDDGKISGLVLNLPTDWTATLTQGTCGAVVTRGATSTDVHFRIAMSADATPGTSTTFAATDGLKIAPSSLNVPLDCT